MARVSPDVTDLVNLLSDGGHAAVTAAVELRNIATTVDNRMVIINAGAINHVVTMLRVDGAHANESHEAAASLLRRLCTVDAVTREAITEAGAVGPLVALLSGSAPDAVKVAAVAVLKRIAAEQIGTVAIAAAGGVDALVTLLRITGTERVKLKISTTAAIMNIAANARNLTFLMKAEIASVLVDLLREEEDAENDEVKLRAIKGLFNLSTYNGNTVVLAEAGIVNLLSVLLFGNESEAIKMFAAHTMHSLVAHTDDHTVQYLMEVGSYGIVDLLMALLVGDITENVKLLAALALENLTINAKQYGYHTEAGAAAPLVALLASHGSRDPYAAVSLVCQRLQRHGVSIAPFELLGWNIRYLTRSSGTQGDWYAKSPNGLMYRSHAQLLANYPPGPLRYKRRPSLIYTPGGKGTKRSRAESEAFFKQHYSSI